MDIKLEKVIIKDGKPELVSEEDINEGKKKTLTYNILSLHNSSDNDEKLEITVDSLTSHDITYVGIIQTALASGMKRFPVPYVLTNCHNSLCAVGGTINEDDHVFALSAAHKFGGTYVPASYAVIHSFNREMMSGGNRMIMGSDSHTRYGALGTMGIGEGGGEIAKQLLGRKYEISYPEVMLIYLTGNVKPGIGPHDVALKLIGETYDKGILKNKVLEFVGPGIKNLSQDYRNGIDVMTTETTCLSSIWECDETTKSYYQTHGREEDYKELKVSDGAIYDGAIELDLSEVESMIALPMHPSLAMPINEFKKDPKKYLKEAEERIEKQTGVKIDLVSKVDEEGNVRVDQGIIAGCSGGIYENVVVASKILEDDNIGNNNFTLNIYPDSMPSYLELVKNGTQQRLLESGAVIKSAFCGPCFGAGDTPSNGALSIRHTTRNFPNREGSKPQEDQACAICLMDARSIAATAKNKGILTAATDIVKEDIEVDKYHFDKSLYDKRVYFGYNNEDENYELIEGPNIKPWPKQEELKNNILTKVVTFLDDAVTTTDELIPSGETSSYRSNPLRLAEFTLSRRDPEYVSKAKKVLDDKKEVEEVIEILKKNDVEVNDYSLGSSIYANKPGDGSAREQAASCQRVLGAIANFAKEYATKRYRSNCINWGILPFLIEDKEDYQDAWIYVVDVKESILANKDIKAYSIKGDKVKEITLRVGDLSEEEKDILLSGSLINYYKS